MRAYRLAVLTAAAFMIVTLAAGRALAQGGQQNLGSISVKTVPPDAQVFIDGERWVGPETDGRLVVQVPPGRHLVEIRAPGYRSYVSEIDVRAGETTPLNVSLAGAAPAERRPPAPPRQPGSGGIQQVSNEMRRADSRSHPTTVSPTSTAARRTCSAGTAASCLAATCSSAAAATASSITTATT